MIPRIPEGCERFKKRYGIHQYHYLDIGYISINSAFHQREFGTFERNRWQDICNHARCAWLDEAERIISQAGQNYIPDCYALYAYAGHLAFREGLNKDVVYPWEIDYAHCLAWAEAWAREGNKCHKKATNARG